MNTQPIHLGGATLTALASKALWWPAERLLIVSDLHLGKSERMARRGGALLPPYETTETLRRLSDDIDALHPRTVVCLGDSFDDRRAAEALDPTHLQTLAALMAGRDWIWIEGNHDPGPLTIGGRYCTAVTWGDVTLRHIADCDATGCEISGHYHPKAGLNGRAGRACFLTDGHRLIMPAYGAYTGGMQAQQVAHLAHLGSKRWAILAGQTMARLPVPYTRGAA